MALYPCVECGEDISGQAHVCPHCGLPDAGRLAAEEDADLRWEAEQDEMGRLERIDERLATLPGRYLLLYHEEAKASDWFLVGTAFRQGEAIMLDVVLRGQWRGRGATVQRRLSAAEGLKGHLNNWLAGKPGIADPSRPDRPRSRWERLLGRVTR